MIKIIIQFKNIYNYLENFPINFIKISDVYLFNKSFTK